MPKSDYKDVGDCISAEMGKGRPQDQAVAMCMSMFGMSKDGEETQQQEFDSCVLEKVTEGMSQKDAIAHCLADVKYESAQKSSRKMVHREVTLNGGMTFVASDATVDSYGDVIEVSGWDTSVYESNPVVLFGHDATNIVGRSSRVWRAGGKLMASIELARQGTSALVDTCRALVEQGILRAVSVGFSPTKPPEPIINKSGEMTGFRYNGQRLLEISLVAIPANPSALAIAKSHGLSNDQMRRLFKSGATAQLRQYRAQLDLIRAGGSVQIRK
jgi:HK97 family phage prohead protease